MYKDIRISGATDIRDTSTTVTHCKKLEWKSVYLCVLPFSANIPTQILKKLKCKYIYMCV